MISISGKAKKPPANLTNQTAKNQINKPFVNQDGSKCTKYGKVYERLKAISLHKRTTKPDESGKCFFCESKSEHVCKLQIEHYRPKGKVDKKDTSGTKNKGYYWLGNEWTNLLLACSACNISGAKGSRFPIKGTRATAFNPIKNNKLFRKKCKATNSPLIDEIPLLLNPEIDQPENFLTFDNNGQIKDIPDIYRRGYITYTILKLDRGILQQNRQKVLNDIVNDINVVNKIYDMGNMSDTTLVEFLNVICEKIKKRKEPQIEYSLWGKYINDNFEILIANKYSSNFKTKLINCYNSI